MKIGYLPSKLDISEPRDRRGFYWFVQEKKLKIEIADLNKKYDLIYVVCNGNNLSKLLEYKKKFPKTKLVLDIVDAYLEDRNFINIFFRGIIKFILRKEKKLYFSYTKLLKNFITECYAVICATELQKKTLLKFNKNVKVSLDYMEVDFRRRSKDISLKKNSLDIFWEGKIYSLKHLKIFNKLSEKLKKKIHFHILTNLKVEVIPNMYYLKAKSISNAFNFNFTIHPWTKENVYKVSDFCDIGIIPLNMRDKVAFNKCENKLILMWILGLPVITTATPAYCKAMKNLSNQRLCSNLIDWENNLTKFLESSEIEIKNDLFEIEQKLYNEYSKKRYLDDWVSIFETLNIQLPLK